MAADRFNQGKPKLSMIDSAVKVLTAQVLEFGAQKYDRDNWRKGLKYNSIIDSLERHLNAWKEGEDLDPESGLSHIGHIACNVMFLARFVQDNRQDLDDRVKINQCPAIKTYEQSLLDRGYTQEQINAVKEKDNGKNEREMATATRMATPEELSRIVTESLY